jgi:DNA modification methylase
MINVQVGDHWQLGRHQLWCGDSASEYSPKFDTDLVLTDPPFEMSANKIKQIIIRHSDKFIVAGNGVEYHRLCASSGLRYHFEVVSLRAKPQSLPGSNKPHVTNWNNAFLSLGGEHCFDRELAEGYFPSVLPASKAQSLAAHAKPLEWALALLSVCHAKTVCDPFVGSGTVLIAAEKLGKTCQAIDSDPKKCELTIERWQNATKQEAVHL